MTDGAVVAALLLMRLTGILWIAPVFSNRALPSRLKAALLLMLVLLMLPTALDASVEAPRFTPGTVFTEAVVGLLVGLGAAIFVAAAESAGDTLAVQMGLSGANIVDPTSETQLPVVGHFMGLTVLALILAVGGHVLVLQALHRTLELIPPGSVLRLGADGREVTVLGGTLFLLGLRFAAPVVAAMMVGNVALGVLARTVPQLNVLMVAFPVQIAIGLFGLAIALPYVVTFFSSWPEAYDGLLLRLFDGVSLVGEVG